MTNIGGTRIDNAEHLDFVMRYNFLECCYSFRCYMLKCSIYKAMLLQTRNAYQMNETQQ